MVFTETKHRPTINWNEELDKKIAGRGNAMPAQELAEYSGSWVTCAVGNTCAIIPRTYGGEPYDYKLLNLGVEFHEAIKRCQWRNAKIILLKIEERSAEVIKIELGKRQKPESQVGT